MARGSAVLSMSTKGMPSGLSFITSSIDAVAETRKDARLAEEDLRGLATGRRGLSRGRASNRVI